MHKERVLLRLVLQEITPVPKELSRSPAQYLHIPLAPDEPHVPSAKHLEHRWTGVPHLQHCDWSSIRVQSSGAGSFNTEYFKLARIFRSDNEFGT